MRRIDELPWVPFAGARMLRDLLRHRTIRVGRKHMTTPMRRIGIAALHLRAFATGGFGGKAAIH